MRKPYRELGVDERQILTTMVQAKATMTNIAETLGRDRPKIHRAITYYWYLGDEVSQVMDIAM